MSRITPARPLRVAIRVLAVATAVAAAGATSVAAAALVSGETPGERWQVAPVAAAAVAAAATWPVVRRRADVTSDRLVLGSRRDPDEVIRSFEANSGQEIALPELLVQLAESLVRTFAASSGEVWLVDSGRLDLHVAVPSGSSHRVDLDSDTERALAGSGVVGRAWAELWLPELTSDDGGQMRLVPATHAGQVLGLVVVRRVEGAAPFEPVEDASLSELGPRVGVVLHNRHLDAALQTTLEDLRRTNDELRASRVRLVTTADSERRRIERDLHDGAQQHLVALAVNLRLADDAIAEDPSVSREVLGALAGDVRAAIAELRSLAHGIFPPLLTDAGLVEALRVAADRAASVVIVTSHDVGRYATEVETAVYFCCMEALQNAAKHAPGAAVRLHVEGTGQAVRFSVEDDGPGPGDALVTAGHGLSNMTDRVGALGGTLSVGTSPSGGTCVSGEIPVAAPEAGSKA